MISAIALFIASNSPDIAVGLVVGVGLGYLVGAEVWFDKGYQRGRRALDRRGPLPEPQAPRALPVALRDYQERRVIRLVPTGPSKGRK